MAAAPSRIAAEIDVRVKQVEASRARVRVARRPWAAAGALVVERSRLQTDDAAHRAPQVAIETGTQARPRGEGSRAAGAVCCRSPTSRIQAMGALAAAHARHTKARHRRIRRVERSALLLVREPLDEVVEPLFEWQRRVAKRERQPRTATEVGRARVEVRGQRRHRNEKVKNPKRHREKPLSERPAVERSVRGVGLAETPSHRASQLQIDYDAHQ